MEAQTSPRRSAQSRRRVLAAVAIGVALAVGAFILVRALTGGDEEGGKLEGPGKAFTLEYPKGWTVASKKELARLPGSPFAVVRRTDRRGIVIVNGQRRVTKNFDKLGRQLDRSLRTRIPDFRKVSSQTVAIKAGTAFTYSYIRRRRGTVHILVVVPVGRRGYTLDAVVPGKAQDVARQVGAIIRSFDVR